MPKPASPSATLERRIGLRSAVLFNMLEMIGVGPFITLPLVIAAAGYRLSVWAWVLGAVIAIADGLVWAELGAAFPRAGGSYAFLEEIYGPRAPAAGSVFSTSGRSDSPRRFPSLPAASASPAFSPSSGPISTRLPSPLFPRSTTPTSPPPPRVFSSPRSSIATSVPSLASPGCSSPESSPPSPASSSPDSRTPRPPAAGTCLRRPRSPRRSGLGGLAQATLLATYCYWGYYNVTFSAS